MKIQLLKKNSVDRLIRKSDLAKERISKLKDTFEEIIKNEAEENKEIENVNEML